MPDKHPHTTTDELGHFTSYVGPVLGHLYEDRITGYSGRAIGHCTYLTGCSQTLLVPRRGEDGKRQDGEWFDDQRLQMVAGSVAIELNNGMTPGCDREAPKR